MTVVVLNSILIKIQRRRVCGESCQSAVLLFPYDHLGDNRECGVPIPIQLLNALSINPAAFRGHTTGLLITRIYNTVNTMARSLLKCMGMIPMILFGGSIIRLL